MAIAQDAHIGVGAFCDAYPSVEHDYRVTRAAVEELVSQGRRFTIITKGSLVVRDIDLIANNPRARVRISLCTMNEDALRRVDPLATTATKRVEGLRTLHDAGVKVGLNCMPWIPEVSDAAALVDAIDDDISIVFGPLNVLWPAVAPSPYGKRFRQADINAAYDRESARIGRRRTSTGTHPSRARILSLSKPVLARSHGVSPQSRCDCGSTARNSRSGHDPQPGGVTKAIVASLFSHDAVSSGAAGLRSNAARRSK